MARQAGACWACGAEWATEVAPTTTLRAINGATSALTVPRFAGAAVSLDAERWVNEGGSVGSERAIPSVPFAATR